MRQPIESGPQDIFRESENTTERMWWAGIEGQNLAHVDWASERWIGEIATENSRKN